MGIYKKIDESHCEGILIFLAMRNFSFHFYLMVAKEVGVVHWW
jgi:hypothetical protein